MKLPIGYIDLSLGTMLLLLVALRPGGVESPRATVEVAGAPTAPSEAALPVVRIARDGALTLEGAPLRLDQVPGLKGTLRAAVVSPDDNSTYGKVASVLAAMHAAGITTELEVKK